jgi:hypothetical protein
MVRAQPFMTRNIHAFQASLKLFSVSCHWWALMALYGNADEQKHIENCSRTLFTQFENGLVLKGEGSPI